MMEGLTADGRRAVERAQEEARRLHHGFLGCEHVLLGLSASQDDAAGTALAAFGLDPEALRQRVIGLIGDGDQVLDADALRSLGIDLDAVRQAAEASFGPGALDAKPKARRRVGPGGRAPLTPRLKDSFGLAARIARNRGDRKVGAAHLLLGMIAQSDNAALRVLRLEGVEADALRQEVTRRMAEAA